MSSPVYSMTISSRLMKSNANKPNPAIFDWPRRVRLAVEFKALYPSFPAPCSCSALSTPRCIFLCSLDLFLSASLSRASTSLSFSHARPSAFRYVPSCRSSSGRRSRSDKSTRPSRLARPKEGSKGRWPEMTVPLRSGTGWPRPIHVTFSALHLRNGSLSGKAPLVLPLLRWWCWLLLRFFPPPSVALLAATSDAPTPPPWLSLICLYSLYCRQKKGLIYRAQVGGDPP
mmetsp:Transcript_20498/g.58541  ORF Transcript_20498/g.58541 Transcript_20498/m.58541 type:complete len:229 (+) Transcript_20498:585-1271(+)